jgi:hypothetical protein
MVKRSGKGPERIFIFRPLRVSDLSRISAWVSQMNPQHRLGRKKIAGAFNRHYYDLWHSRWARTWVMTIRSRPAFCLTLCTSTGIKEGEPRPESGCGNQLFLLPSRSIGQSNRRLLLAWQAATVFVFLKVGLRQVQVAVPVSQNIEGEALLTLGYRLIETTTEGPEATCLYLCRQEEFTPVL